MEQLITGTNEWGVLPASPETGISGAQAIQVSNEQERVALSDVTLPPPPFESDITPGARLSPIWSLWFQLVRARVGGAIAHSPSDVELLGSFDGSAQSSQSAQGLNDRGILGSFQHADLPTLYNAIRFALDPRVVPVDGLTYWDAAEKTLATTIDAAAGVTLQHGQELQVRCVNKTGATIPNGSIVYANGAQGNRPTIALADASDYSKCRGVAIATQDILDNHEGFCTRFGVVREFNTFGMGDASPLYLSATTPGAVTTTAPTSPNFVVNLGLTLNSTPNGSIYFRPNQTLGADNTLADPGTDTLPPTQLAVKSAIATSAASVQQIFTDTHVPNGFLSRTDNTITIATRTITVSPTGANFAIYQNGIKYLKTGDATCQTTIPATNGLHYIYFDSSQQLVNSLTPWDIVSPNTPVAVVFWNGSEGSIGDERHGAWRDIKWHKWAHSTIGTRYESGLSQTYPTAAQSKIQIESGIIHDEDINFSIPKQVRCRNYYETAAATWTWANGTDNGGNDRPYLWNAGTSRVQYPKTTAAYALTDAAANEYVVVWAYATSDISRAIYIVTAAKATAYANLNDARNAKPPSTYGLLTPELKIIYRWIFKGDGTYQEGVDYRQASSLPAGGQAAVQHNDTLNKQGGTAGEYYHMTSAQATSLGSGISATKTFYTASTPYGSPTVLNTVTISNGIITSWTQV